MNQNIEKMNKFETGLNLDWASVALLDTPLVEVNSGQRIVRCNGAFADLLGESPETLCGVGCHQAFCREPHLPESCFCLHARPEDEDLSTQIFMVRSGAGDVRMLRGQALPLKSGALLVMKDMTEQMTKEKQVLHHREQTALLSRISHRLIALPVDKTQEGIEYALAELGQFMKLDRVYLFSHHRAEQTVRKLHEWSSSGCPVKRSPSEPIPVADLPWFWQRMTDGQPVRLNKIGDLPVEADMEHKRWCGQDIQSLLVVPLQREAVLWGFLGVDAVAQCRSWNTEDLQLLELAGELLRSLIARKESCEALRHSDSRFSALADAAPALIWEQTGDGRLCYGNRSWRDFSGCADLGLDMSAFVFHGDQASFESACRLSCEKRAPMSLEIRLRRHDGTYRWMQLSGAPLGSETGSGATIISAFDVTDHKIAEKQLLHLNEDLEQRVVDRTAELKIQNQKLTVFSQAIEQSPCSIVLTDLDAHIEYVNPKFSEVTGYSAEEALGQNPSVLKGQNGLVDYEQLWLTLLAGQEWRGEFHNRRKNGEFYWELASISPVRDPDGQVRHYLAVKEDITARKALEEAVLCDRDKLQKAKQELEKAYHELKASQSQMLQQEKMASIGQLAAGVAHEINNPVGFIKSNLATLGKYVERLKQFIDLQSTSIASCAEADRETLAATQKKLKIDYLLADIPDLIAESLDGAERVKTIVQNLKSFSRVDQTEFIDADINECLESTINIVWNELKYKVTLERDLGALPRIKCFPQQLNQVFMNILVNGAQAIEKQGEIHVSTAVEGDFIFIRISDNGCGIAAKNLDRIFEPFFTTKDVGKGTGLGMSISYEIIKKQGGEITVDSQVGKGTTFTISLPLEGAPPPAGDEDIQTLD